MNSKIKAKKNLRSIWPFYRRPTYHTIDWDSTLAIDIATLFQTTISNQRTVKNIFTEAKLTVKNWPIGLSNQTCVISFINNCPRD